MVDTVVDGLLQLNLLRLGEQDLCALYERSF